MERSWLTRGGKMPMPNTPQGSVSRLKAATAADEHRGRDERAGDEAAPAHPGAVRRRRPQDVGLGGRRLLGLGRLTRRRLPARRAGRAVSGSAGRAGAARVVA